MYKQNCFPNNEASGSSVSFALGLLFWVLKPLWLELVLFGFGLFVLNIEAWYGDLISFQPCGSLQQRSM